MPVPPECQPIADAIANLTAQEQTQLGALPGLVGIDKWKGMEQLGVLRQQIADQQASLNQCLKDHAADLTTQIVVFDLPGNSGPNRIARLWQLASGQVVKQTATVQAGEVTLLGVLGSTRQSFGITIEETDHPTVNGPDFRSGPLPAGPNVGDAPDPATRIEIVILDPIVITSDSLSAAAPPLPIQLSFPAGGVGSVSITVNMLQILMRNGAVSLSASGTASLGGGFPLFSTTPFTFTNTLHVAPTFNMSPSVVVEALAGTIPVLSMPGLVGTVLGTIAPLLSSSLLDRAVQPLVSLLNNLIINRVTTNLGLPALPSGAVLSVRELSADNDSITLTPVLGAFGTVLSGFQPSPLPPVRGLFALSVQPASISTSDPAQGTAQGQVTLDGPAPAGGVTIQLTSDRTDVLAIDPSSLPIGEGASSGTFTVSAIGQPLMATTHVDATIRASFGAQTLTSPISVKPEPPATTVTPAAVPVSPPPVSTDPGARVPGIMSIDLYTPPPLPRGRIQGRVTLDGLVDHTVTGLVVLSPQVIPPIRLFFPPELGGAPASYFEFTLEPSFPGNSLRITAIVDGGSTKSIDVAVA
jgi:hypothetical protein